jgi:hypothetical protein
MKLLLISATTLFLLGAKPFNPYPPTEKYREEQKRIQEVLMISLQLNRQPKPISNQRALRNQQDQYAASQLPILPRNLFKEAPRRIRTFH